MDGKGEARDKGSTDGSGRLAHSPTGAMIQPGMQFWLKGLNEFGNMRKRMYFYDMKKKIYNLKRYLKAFLLLFLLLQPIAFITVFSGDHIYTSWYVKIPYEKARDFCAERFRVKYLDINPYDGSKSSRFRAPYGENPKDSVDVFFWPDRGGITVKGFGVCDASLDSRKQLKNSHEKYERYILSQFPDNASWRRTNGDLWFFYLASFVCPVNLLFGVPETYITYAIVMMLIAFLVFLMIKYPDKRLLEQDVESGN